MPSNWYPGDVAVGSKVNAAPQVFAQTVTTQSGLAAAGAKPTITALASAGSGAAISSQLGYDQAGSFILTGGTAPSAGSICSVSFGQALSSAPSSVIVTAGNQTAGGSASIGAGAISVSKSGFTVFAASAGTLGATYAINYQVVR